MITDLSDVQIKSENAKNVFNARMMLKNILKKSSDLHQSPHYKSLQERLELIEQKENEIKQNSNHK